MISKHVKVTEVLVSSDQRSRAFTDLIIAGCGNVWGARYECLGYKFSFCKHSLTLSYYYVPDTVLDVLTYSTGSEGHTFINQNGDYRDLIYVDLLC